MKAKLLQSNLKPEDFYINAYDSMTRDCLSDNEMLLAELRANPTEENIQLMRAHLKKTIEKDFTQEDVIQIIEQAFGLMWVAIDIGITEDRAQQKDISINKWRKEAKKKDHRILNTTPFESVKCSSCPTEMTYKWSTLFDYPNNTSRSQVLFFYECLQCDKRAAFFEDGQLWISEGINNCPICNSKRETTLTQDKEGKNFIIYVCNKCGSKQVESGINLSK